MKKPTREEQLTRALDRLAAAVRRCHEYGGCYCGVMTNDLALVLEELESLRHALIEQRQALVEAP